ATPYLGWTFTGWIAPASPGALLILHRSGLSPHTPCQSPGALTRVAACTLALPPIRDTLIEGFSHFVTSMTAPIASGWSGCRVGLAPTGKRRLCTAHTRNGHQPFGSLPVARPVTAGRR